MGLPGQSTRGGTERGADCSEDGIRSGPVWSMMGEITWDQAQTGRQPRCAGVCRDAVPARVTEAVTEL